MFPRWDDAYTVRHKIRETAHADVYRAQRKRDLRAVLLKVPRENRSGAAATARLEHEDAILRSVEGDGVIRTLGLDVAGNACALVLEDPGEVTLDKEIARGRPDLTAFLETAISMATAVETVHGHRVIHKDLKPLHFARRQGQAGVTLIDFSAATQLSLEDRRAVGVGQLEGTLAYMSPEQTGRMNRVTDRRTDLYSLGVSFYELLTGVLPFQTDDPLELVHSHIARAPVHPHVLWPGIPLPLSQIVMKLLSKVAEDRYQDIGGLKADLQRCLGALGAGGVLLPFTLAERDFSDELRIPQKLYGRESQLRELLEAFGRARQGSPELLLIAGQSGIGKSALVNDLQREMVRCGRLVAGKFDQIGRSVPYAPLAEACTELVRSILTESAEVLASWRQRLLEAVGPNGRLMSELVPELELVIGARPPLPKLEAADSQHRFELVFQSFLSVFATEQHPLVFFLDDLQWADAASLRLIHLLLTGARHTHLLVIGAYRDQEVDPVHPLSLALAELRKANATLSEIALPPLAIEDIRHLVGDTLRGCSDEAAQRLAALCLRKTHGNPFFLTQFLTGLHKDGLLHFDREERRWTWDDARVDTTMVTDNVVDFLVGKLRRLPEDTQSLLELAACIGHRFDRRTLAVISEQDPASLERTLWPALREGLVVPLDLGLSDADPNPLYRFQHDRVQQAAYSLIGEARRRAVHLGIGRLMSEHRDADDGHGSHASDDFTIVNHLNLGAALITDDHERHTLADLNLSLAHRARQAAAYGAALGLLSACFELLGDRPWEGASYDLALASQLARAECEYLNGNTDHAVRLLDDIDERAHELFERVSALALKTTILTTSGKLIEAGTCGLRTATLLGASFPATPAEYGPAIGAELGAIYAALAGRSVDSFLDLPEMTDRESIALADIFHCANASATQVNPELMVLIIVKAVNLFLRQGNCSVSPYFYACYGLLLAVQGQHETGYRMGKIGLELCPRWNNKVIDAATPFVVGGFIAFWRAPLSESIEHLRRSQKISLESGNYIYAAYCMSFQALHRFFAGESLDQLAADLPSYEEFMRRTGDLVNERPMELIRRLIANLKGEATTPGGLDGGGFDTALAERGVLGRGNFLIDSHFLFRAIGRYLAGEFAESARLIAETGAVFTGNMFGSEIAFWRTLSACAVVDRANVEQKKTAIETVRKDVEKLRGWAISSPGTFGHRHALMAAELAALDEDERALELYEAAIAASEKAGSHCHEALANELAGRYLLRRDRQKLGAFYLGQARDAYERWGATRKVRDLTSEIRSERAAQSELRTDHLDTMAVMRSSQAISTEIVLSRLVEKLMAIVIEQAGAERGYLLLFRDAELWLEAAAGAAAETASFARHQVVAGENASGAPLPWSVLGYVQRTQKTILLTGAERTSLFSGDAYLLANRPRSVLCLPMMRQGQLVGMLYLENRLAGGAFNDRQVGFLEVLSAQAAISLENAALYEGMETRVAERTRELAASLQLLKDNQAQLIEAERKTTVARYESELAIARKIQTSILPKNLGQEGFDMAAGMVTASEVGGDYYDVVPAGDGGFWLGVGDVSGHGLNAGLMMLMLQGGLSALMRRDPNGDPGRLICLVNQTLYENVRLRLGSHDFATLSLLRFYPDGRFQLAGAHEEMLVWRAATGEIERLPTPGTWVGVTRDIEAHTVVTEHRLADNDVLVAYTDGIIEAGVERGAAFDLSGLERLLAGLCHRPVQEICDEVFKAVAAHAPEPTDDRTLLVLRRRG